jgi:hypothetical protein
MKKPSWKSVALLSLATLITPAFAQQSANQARPGTLNYVEGHASIDGSPVSSQSVGFATLQPGQQLATADGKVEMLLTPGVFLRLGNNSTIKMVKPDLTHTEVRLERGHAEVEADQLYKQNTILIDQNGGQTQILKNGLYAFNADKNTVRTFDGKASVYPGNNLESNIKPIEVKGGRELALTGEPVKPQRFDKDRYESENSLYRWSSLRSQYLGEANEDLAEQYAGYGPGDGYGGFAPGWDWDPALYSYTWLPGGGPFFSPFGFGFYSPGYLYGGGLLYGGYGGFYGGGYGYRGGRDFYGRPYGGGYAHALAVQHASQGANGFHSNAVGGGGFHGGGFGGGGGFHGGGGGGGGHR